MKIARIKSFPLVSVIMPAYNAAATIAESIESVLYQTYQNWELIVVNDASTDSTLDVIALFADADSRVCVYTNQCNSGIASTRNIAMEKAKGEYIAFLDSDDVWQPQKLDKQLYYMMDKNAVISYTATSYMDAGGQMSDYILQAVPKLEYEQLLRKNLMSCSSVMVRSDLMSPFPVGFMHEDYAVWLRIVKKKGQAFGLDEPLLVYRMWAASRSSGRVKSAILTFNVYRYIGYGFVRSIFFTFRYARYSVLKRCQIWK